jgi:hypothetical protein
VYENTIDPRRSRRPPMVVPEQPAYPLSLIDHTHALLPCPADELIPNPLVTSLVVIMGDILGDGMVERPRTEEDHPIQASRFDRDS